MFTFNNNNIYLNKYKKLNYMNFTRQQLLNLSLHIGQKKKKWSKIMTILVIGIRHSILLLNLDFFFYNFSKVLLFCSFIFKYYGKVVSYSEVTNLKTAGLGRFFLHRTHNLYYDGPYIGGLLSNIYALRKRLKKKMKLNQYIYHNFKKLHLKLPDFALIFNTHQFFYLVKEATYLGIPALSIVDSDMDFLDTTYFLIGNPLSLFFNVYVILLVSLLKKNVVRTNYLYFYKVRFYLIFFILKLKIYLILLKKLKKIFKNINKNIKSFFFFIKNIIEFHKVIKLVFFSHFFNKYLVFFKFFLFFFYSVFYLKFCNFLTKFVSSVFLNKLFFKIILFKKNNKLGLIRNLLGEKYTFLFNTYINLDKIQNIFFEKMNFFLYFLKKLIIKKKRIFLFYFFFFKLLNKVSFFYFKVKKNKFLNLFNNKKAVKFLKQKRFLFYRILLKYKDYYFFNNYNIFKYIVNFTMSRRLFYKKFIFLLSNTLLANCSSILKKFYFVFFKKFINFLNNTVLNNRFFLLKYFKGKKTLNLRIKKIYYFILNKKRIFLKLKHFRKKKKQKIWVDRKYSLIKSFNFLLKNKVKKNFFKLKSFLVRKKVYFFLLKILSKKVYIFPFSYVYIFFFKLKKMQNKIKSFYCFINSLFLRDNIKNILLSFCSKINLLVYFLKADFKFVINNQTLYNYYFLKYHNTYKVIDLYINGRTINLFLFRHLFLKQFFFNIPFYMSVYRRVYNYSFYDSDRALFEYGSDSYMYWYEKNYYYNELITVFRYKRAEASEIVRSSIRFDIRYKSLKIFIFFFLYLRIVLKKISILSSIRTDGFQNYKIAFSFFFRTLYKLNIYDKNKIKKQYNIYMYYRKKLLNNRLYIRPFMNFNFLSSIFFVKKFVNLFSYYFLKKKRFLFIEVLKKKLFNKFRNFLNIKFKVKKKLNKKKYFVLLKKFSKNFSFNLKKKLLNLKSSIKEKKVKLVSKLEKLVLTKKRGIKKAVFKLQKRDKNNLFRFMFFLPSFSLKTLNFSKRFLFFLNLKKLLMFRIKPNFLKSLKNKIKFYYRNKKSLSLKLKKKILKVIKFQKNKIYIYERKKTFLFNYIERFFSTYVLKNFFFCYELIKYRFGMKFYRWRRKRVRVPRKVIFAKMLSIKYLLFFFIKYFFKYLYSRLIYVRKKFLLLVFKATKCFEKTNSMTRIGNFNLIYIVPKYKKLYKKGLVKLNKLLVSKSIWLKKLKKINLKIKNWSMFYKLFYKMQYIMFFTKKKKTKLISFFKKNKKQNKYKNYNKNKYQQNKKVKKIKFLSFAFGKVYQLFNYKKMLPKTQTKNYYIFLRRNYLLCRPRLIKLFIDLTILRKTFKHYSILSSYRFYSGFYKPFAYLLNELLDELEGTHKTYISNFIFFINNLKQKVLILLKLKKHLRKFSKFKMKLDRTFVFPKKIKKRLKRIKLLRVKRKTKLNKKILIKVFKFKFLKKNSQILLLLRKCLVFYLYVKNKINKNNYIRFVLKKSKHVYIYKLKIYNKKNKLNLKKEFFVLSKPIKLNKLINILKTKKKIRKSITNYKIFFSKFNKLYIYLLINKS